MPDVAHAREGGRIRLLCRTRLVQERFVDVRQKRLHQTVAVEAMDRDQIEIDKPAGEERKDQGAAEHP
jgi:hypothetical protein